jgi:putative addiction module component (TIGR02574 family)
MSRALQVPPPGFDELSVDEQIEYVQALWDHIAANPERVPVPDWHREELDRRLDDLEKNPNDSVSWEDLKARLRSDSR